MRYPVRYGDIKCSYRDVKCSLRRLKCSLRRLKCSYRDSNSECTVRSRVVYPLAYRNISDVLMTAFRKQSSLTKSVNPHKQWAYTVFGVFTLKGKKIQSSQRIPILSYKDIPNSPRADRTLIPRFRAVYSSIELWGRGFGEIRTHACRFAVCRLNHLNDEAGRSCRDLNPNTAYAATHALAGHCLTG